MSLCNPIEASLTNRWILKNLECDDVSLVGFASKGENMEQCSFHLVPCFEECSPCICSCSCEFIFLGTSSNINHILVVVDVNLPLGQEPLCD
jgi:hypothetical protein